MWIGLKAATVGMGNGRMLRSCRRSTVSHCCDYELSIMSCLLTCVTYLTCPFMEVCFALKKVAAYQQVHN